MGACADTSEYGSGGVARSARNRSLFALSTATWRHDLEDPLTIAPFLALLHASLTPALPVLNKTAATTGELAHYLAWWAQPRNRHWEILWLGFHGEPGCLHLADEHGKSGVVGIDWLEERLQSRAAGRIIHFGSCSALNIHGNRINRFLRRTGALAVTGFDRRVEWLDAGVLEMLVIRAIFCQCPDRRGLAAVRRWMDREMGPTAKRLGFRMCVRPD